MRFECNLSLLLGRMEARRRVDFTGVELASSVEIASLVEKATAGSVEKAVADLRTVQVERELCAG
jgi:hypothetical protein